MTRHLLWAAVIELIAAALASGSDYTVTSNVPPGYTVVNKLQPKAAPAPREKDGPPAGYPPAPAGYVWEKNPLGPDGWGLRQVAPAAAPVPVAQPRVLTDAQGRRYVYQCQGGTCVRVYLP